MKAVRLMVLIGDPLLYLRGHIIKLLAILEKKVLFLRLIKISTLVHSRPDKLRLAIRSVVRVNGSLHNRRSVLDR